MVPGVSRSEPSALSGEPSASPPTRLPAAWIVAVGGAWLVLAMLLLVAPERLVLSLASDDAYYYFKIAAHIARGDGSTFDGIAPTNGYHPVWMAVVVGIHAAFSGDLVTSAACALALCGLLCAVTLVLAHRLVDRFVAPGLGAIAVAVLLLPNALAAMLNGLETSLAMLVTLALAWYCYARRALDPRTGPRVGIALGAWLGLAFLSRLDLVFLPIAAGIVTVAAGCSGLARPRIVLARAAAMLLGFGTLVGPYLLWNRARFGSFMPISGAVKSSFPEIRQSLHLEGDAVLGLVLLGLVSLLVAIVSFREMRRRGGLALVDSPLPMIWMACCGHFLNIYLFMSWGVYWWHFTLSAAALALALPAALAMLPQLPRRLVLAASAAVAAAALTAQLGLASNRLVRHEAWYDAALWARRHSDRDAVFALKDAGLFSYFSERRVVNLDGKANSRAYWDHVKSGKVDRYLRDAQVSYVADIDGVCDDRTCVIKILTPNRPAAFIRLRTQDEVFRGEHYAVRGFSPVGGAAQFVVWRYPGHPRRPG